jgi:TP901 family phage tail tape measure protein
MALNTIDVNITVHAPGVEATINKVVSGVDRIGTAADKMAGVRTEMAKLTSAFAGLFAVRIAGDAILGLVSKANMMTEAMNKVRIASDLNAEQQDRLKTAIIAASGATRLSFEESASAAKNLLQAGLDVGSTIAALTPVLGLAQIGETGTEEIAKLVGTLARFGISAQGIELAFDKMFKAAKLSTLDVKEFTQVLTKAAPGAIAAGISFDSMVSSLALIRSGMANASSTGTLFGRAMRTFIDTKKVQEIEKAFGVVLIAGGKLRDPLHIFNDLSQSIGTNILKAGELGRIMGVQGSAPVLSSLKAFREGIVANNGQLVKGAELADFFNNSVARAGGEGAKALAISMESLGAQFDRVKNSLGVFVGLALEGLNTNLGAVVGKIANLVTGLNSLIGSGTRLKSAFGFIASWAVTFGAVAVSLLALVSGFRIAGAAAGLLRAGILSIGPARLVIGGIEAAIMRLSIVMMGSVTPVRFLGIALRGLGAALGPIGILLTVLTLVPGVISGIASLLGFGGKNDAEKKKAAELAALETGAAAQEKSAHAVDAAAEALKAQVTKFEKTLDAPFPFFDPKVMNTAIKIRDAVGAAFGPEAAGKLGPHLQVLGEAFKELRTQGGLTEMTMRKMAGGEGQIGALEALKASGGLLESLGQLPKGTAKQVQEMTDALEKSVSAPAVKTRGILGTLIPQFATREQQAAATARAEELKKPSIFPFAGMAEFEMPIPRATPAAGIRAPGLTLPFQAIAAGQAVEAQSRATQAALTATTTRTVLSESLRAAVSNIKFNQPIEIVMDGGRLPAILRSGHAADDASSGRAPP